MRLNLLVLQGVLGRDSKCHINIMHPMMPIPNKHLMRQNRKQGTICDFKCLFFVTVVILHLARPLIETIKGL